MLTNVYKLLQLGYPRLGLGEIFRKIHQFGYILNKYKEDKTKKVLPSFNLEVILMPPKQLQNHSPSA